MRFKTFVTNINILNIILLTAVVLFAFYILLPLFQVKVTYTLPRVKQTGVTKQEYVDPTSASSMAEYTIIADQNLFHPERTIPTHMAEEEPSVKPEFVLYGTLITDSVRIAYIEDLKSPHTTVGRGKRQVTLHLGNTLSGYTMSEVYHDKVVMVKGDDRIEVKVLDSRYKKKDVSAPPSLTTKNKIRPSKLMGRLESSGKSQRIVHKPRTLPQRIKKLSPEQMKRALDSLLKQE